MKMLNKILAQKPVFLHNWKEKLDVIFDFENVFFDGEDYRNKLYSFDKSKMDKIISKYQNINIIFASYGDYCYEGDAWVLFEEDGALFEVNGSHCSCFGLEGQWCPEDVELRDLEYRIQHGTFGKEECNGNHFRDELIEFLGIKT